MSDQLATIEEVIEDARNGRMFILVDDEDRENEGDLIIPAQMATPDAINFMAMHGRGLICLSLTDKRAKELGLQLMAANNSSRMQTAFTVSIEAAEGVTTGISAHDRAHTISVAIDPEKGRADIASPGHVFPLVARDGGTLVRAGHTEAAVDIARLAGLLPAGVICEIMNEDGTMARLPDLLKFSRLHGLKIAKIADLIAYRRRYDHLVKCVAESRVNTIYGGEWLMKVYANTVDYAEHIALVKGDISKGGPVPVRMHVINMFQDVAGELGSGTGQLRAAQNIISEEGRGVVVIILPNSRTAISDSVKAHMNGATHQTPPLKDYGIGAQILLDLGVHEMELLSNTKRTIVGIEGYDLKVVGQRNLPTDG